MMNITSVIQSPRTTEELFSEIDAEMDNFIPVYRFSPLHDQEVAEVMSELSMDNHPGVKMFSAGNWE